MSINPEIKVEKQVDLLHTVASASDGVQFSRGKQFKFIIRNFYIVQGNIMSEYGYLPEAPEQSFGQNSGIFTPKDIYDLTRADKYTNYGQLELISNNSKRAVTLQ